MLSHDLDDLFKQTRLILSEGSFVLGAVSCDDGARLLPELNQLAESDQPFMWFRDGFECTFMIRTEVWHRVQSFAAAARIETGFRLLTLDVELAWNVVGYLARVTQALAEAGISVGVLSSFSRDHLLIKQEKLEAATQVLRTLIVKGLIGDADGV